ncbi:hypothetical protein [Alicyclobacillus mengziensis]|uniref:Uncharacterized protein n=1 Tax=Alicyclobacillus mengziensis TaxID=2931921 RepID=A0A9X7VWQ1_9BACL|nr:hypothetical protein [Alicyclobacillus mengziensis]QSO45975.1 hypothetical protein JZ786_15725 [Alicyclobacillus mengziensis]
MHDNSAYYGPLTYWHNLLGLCTGERVVQENLDIPLDKAVVRSRYAAFWSSTLILYAIGVYLLELHGWPHWLTSIPMAFKLVMFILGVLVIIFAAGFIAYGLLRLYTLVGHNLTTNLMKVRGQRLRLLSAETTLLSLSAPLVAGFVVHTIFPTLGWGIMMATVLYGIVLTARIYNTIFHIQGLSGLWVFLGGTLVTWFVLAIGALAVAVAGGVIGFVLLLILRGFRH